MKTETWQRVEELFDRVVAAPPDRRAALLDEACGDDAELRAEVQSLLEHDARAGADFLASPIISVRPDEDLTPAWAQDLIGRTVGRYTIVRPLGHGGMGSVFEARQEQPARTVALKVLRPGFSAPSALARFRLEPEVLGRLQHPNIAQVFEAGVHTPSPSQGEGWGEGPAEPIPYFAMEYIADAQPLREYADARELSTRERLELFAKVCDAIQHGHQKGIVHRDLKPANILVGADGEPKVIDFGVARASDADIVMTTQCTRLGDLVGTVHYMSPEQCDGDPALIDTRSDVYSLGVVLYELLTGAAPYETTGTTVYEAIRAIKEEPPRRPSAVVGGAGRPVRHLRGDIDVVLLKALEKDRARRYASVAELGADIRCIVENRPIRARPPSPLYLLGKYVRRNRWRTAAVAAVALGVTAALAALLTWQSLRAEADQRRREADLRRAAEVARYGAAMIAAETALQSHDAAAARVILEDPAHVQLRGWEWRHLRQRVDQSQRVISSTSAQVVAAAIDPTGRHVAAVPDGQEYKLLLYRSAGVSGHPQELPVKRVVATTFSHDGRHLAVAARDDSDTVGLYVFTIDSEAAELLCRWRADDQVTSALAFCPTEPLLLATAVDVEARLVLWDLSGLSPKAPAPRRLCSVPNQTATKSLVFSPNGAYLAAGGDDWTIRLFDVERLRHDAPDALLAVLRGHTYYVWDVAFSADGRWLASASIDETVRLWDVQGCIAQGRAGDNPTKTALGSGAEVAVLRGHSEGVRAVAFDPDGRYLVSGGVDRLIRVWELDRRAILTDPVARDDEDGAACWETPVHGQIRALRGHENGIICLGVTSNGEIISASADGSVRAWLPGTEDVPRLHGHNTSVGSVTFTPDGRFLISADTGSRMGPGIIVWEPNQCAPVARRHLRRGENAQGVACWNAGGRTLLAAATFVPKEHRTGTARGRVVVWELGHETDHVSLEHSLGTLPCPPALAAHLDAAGAEQVTQGFCSLTVSRDGRRLAAGHTSGNVCVWEFETAGRAARVVTAFPAYARGHGQVAFLDEQGDFLATACTQPQDPTAEVAAIRVWDANTGREVSGSPYTRHAGAVMKLAVDPACSLLASASADRTIGLWHIDRSDGPPRLQWRGDMRGHTDSVYSLAFHPVPSERRLASGAWDRTIRLWDIELLAAVAVLHGHAGPVHDLAFDPAGERLASVSSGALGRDNVARIWDAGDGYADPAARRERTLVMDAHDCVSKTVRDSALRLDTAMRRLLDWDPQTDWAGQVRGLALERFEGFVMRPDYFGNNAWRVVAVPGRSPGEYDQARHWAQAATHISPEDYVSLGIRGAAEYRCGDLEAALQTLTLAQELWLETAPAPNESSVATWAFMAMTHAARGALAEACSELNEVRRHFDALVSESRREYQDYPDLVRLLEEAERHVQDRTKRPRG